VKRRLILLFAPLALMLTAAVAAAEPQTFKIDTSHSNVGFNIRHFFSRVSGRFKEFSGNIQFDEKNLAGSSVDVTIQAASIDTGNERRDGDLRSASFFNTDTLPTITFKSTKVVPGPEKTFLIYGDFTMHGVTKPVTLEANLLGVGQVAMGGRPPRTIAGFEAKTTIDRKDYGIVWNRTLDQGGTMLGDDVAINLTVEASPPMDPNAMRPAGAPAAPAAPEKK
jgi:polyisoprenoid-binding protein YceI